jgi:hypothetical protein
MTKRAQRQRWLFASSLICAFTFTHLAMAAHPSAGNTLLSTPKAEPASVKRAPERISFEPAPPPQLRLRLAPPNSVPLDAPVPERRVLGLTLPTFIAFGLSGVSAGGAIAAGVAATRGNDPTHCDSRCTERGVRQRALLLTTGVLTGVAAAGLTVGITFMFNAPKNPRRDAIRPRFDLGVSDTKAVAKIGWVFSSF